MLKAKAVLGSVGSRLFVRLQSFFAFAVLFFGILRSINNVVGDARKLLNAKAGFSFAG